MTGRTKNPRNSPKNEGAGGVDALPAVKCLNYRNLAEKDQLIACYCPHFSAGPSLTPIWKDRTATRNFWVSCPRLCGRTIHNP